MSLHKESKLIRFNNKFGYGKRWNFHGPRGNSERALLGIPFLGFIVNPGIGNCLVTCHQQPDMTVRLIMSSTLVAIPVLIGLDLVGTLITQPIQSAREKKDKKDIQTISYVRPNLKRKSRKIEKEDSSSQFTVATASEQTSSTPESLEDISIEHSSLLDSSDYE